MANSDLGQFDPWSIRTSTTGQFGPHKNEVRIDQCFLKLWSQLAKVRIDFMSELTKVQTKVRAKFTQVKIELRSELTKLIKEIHFAVILYVLGNACYFFKSSNKFFLQIHFTRIIYTLSVMHFF